MEWDVFFQEFSLRQFTKLSLDSKNNLELLYLPYILLLVFFLLFIFIVTTSCSIWLEILCHLHLYVFACVF